MRRKLLTLAAVLILTGCSGSRSGEDKLEESFTCTVTAEETGYSAELERAAGSGWNITFTEPSTVSGLRLTYLTDGKCTLSFEGHTAVYERDELPESGMFELAVSAADMCIENRGVKALRDGDETVRTGTLRGIAFSAHSKDGKLTQLEFTGGARFSFVPK